MTKILCDITGCKHNSSCCLATDKKETICNKEIISFKVDEEICQTVCSQFEEDFDKEIECKSCQISKYGGIKLPKKIHFENKKDNNNLF